MNRLKKQAEKKYDFDAYSTRTRDIIYALPDIRGYLMKYDKTFGTNFTEEFNEKAAGLNDFFEKVDGDYFGKHYDDKPSE